jgi:tripartite-type tricarboxylate transporter receptor subunit TctC
MLEVSARRLRFAVTPVAVKSFCARALASLLLAGVALVSTWTDALAQAFPDRPISLIVPWPPGGTTDRHLRMLAQIAGRELGQQIVVHNQPGASGTLGPGNMALSAKPDGYTLAQFPSGMLRLSHMQKTAWHPIDDFTFIIGISGYTLGFTVRSDSPYRTFSDFIEAARREPGRINYGSPGLGTTPHLVVEAMAGSAKVKLNHVPFKGSADLMLALLGGHVMAQCDATVWDRHVDSGEVRLLATFGDARAKRWPTVPTAKELGFDVSSSAPYGIVGPKGMDPAVVRKVHDAFRKAMGDPRHMEMLEQLNQELWYRSSEEYAAWARETFAREGVLIEQLGLAAR